jgi:hypothetical protein
MPEFISEIYFSEEYDILLMNGMFNPDRSGTEKEYQNFERDEINLHIKNFAECIQSDQMQTLQEAFPEGY